MGIQAEIFIAKADDALEYNPSQIIDVSSHKSRFKPAEHEGFTDLEFSQLWALIAEETWDEDAHMLEGVAHGEDYGWWLFRFPDIYVNTLCELDAEEIAAAAEAWAKTDELSSRDPRHLQIVIEDLWKMARDTRGTQLGLYLWGCL